MTTMMLLAQAALLLFNSEVARDLARVQGAPRVFVGAQVDEDAPALAWTQCVPESGVLVTQLSGRAAVLDDRLIAHIAAHEVCHALLHKSVICSVEFRTMRSDMREHLKRHMEVEAERCAVDMDARR